MAQSKSDAQSNKTASGATTGNEQPDLDYSESAKAVDDAQKEQDEWLKEREAQPPFDNLGMGRQFPPGDPMEREAKERREAQENPDAPRATTQEQVDAEKHRQQQERDQATAKSR